MESATPSAVPVEDLPRFQALVAEESGLVLDATRPGPLQGAVAERMAARQTGSAQEYYHFLRFHPEGPLELKTFLERLTIGETSFFRHAAQFEALRHSLLPDLLQRRREGPRALTIWSAGCATGEEPYSLAITLLETVPSPETWQLQVLATDLNRESLRRAHEGVYGPRAVRDVPPAWLAAYFTERHGQYRVGEHVRRLVCFTEHNLVKGAYPLPALPLMDLIVCRNVTIYFSLETTRRVVDQLTTCLVAGGYLLLGPAETLRQLSGQV